MTWTLSVSTVLSESPRILRFLEENRRLFSKFDEVLLVCQMRNFPLPEFGELLPPNSRVIRSNSTGISASRNAGIDAFRTDLIWFMDDDVRLANNLDDVKQALERATGEINTLRVQDTASEKMFRKYRPGRELSTLELLQVSSIEITCKRSLFERTGIRFAEWIGIGTSLPSGEENLFLLDAKRRGAQIFHLPITACRHPLVAREIKTMWERPNRTRCMGIVARQYGGLGLLLCLRWTIRGLSGGVQNRWIVDLWRGYFRGADGIPQGWKRLSTSSVSQTR